MEKVVWNEDVFDDGHEMMEAGGLDTARGLIIGLAISQVFWLALALFFFR